MKKLALLAAVSATALVTLVGCGGNQPSSTSAAPSSSEPAVVPVESVTIAEKSKTVYLNEGVFIRASVLPENASVKTLTWTSSDDEIAMVAANGKVVGLKVGTATIRATSVSNPAKYDECVVKVEKKDETIHVTGVTIDQEEASVYTQESINLVASVLPENATEQGIKWTSSDESIAMVNSVGKVVGLSTGIATIKAASVENSAFYKECRVTVSIRDTRVPVESVSVDPTTIALDLGGTITANPVATVLPENATNKSLTWSSSDTSKVLVDSTRGTITAVAATTEAVTVTATSNDDSSKKSTITVTVVDTRDPAIHVQSISMDSSATLDLKDGATKTLMVTVNPSNAWNKKCTFVSSDPAVVSVTPFGDSAVTVKGLSVTVTPVTITATSEDGSKVATCSVSVVDTVKHVTSIAIYDEQSQAIEEIEIKLKDVANVSALVNSDADNQGVNWSIAQGGSSFIRLGAESGSRQTIIADAITTEPIVVYAVSDENPAIKAELHVSVIDPTVHAETVQIKVGTETKDAIDVEKGKRVTLTAVVLPGDTTDKDVVWSIEEGGATYVNLSSTITRTISFLALKATPDENPVYIRATSKDNSEVYARLAVKIIDPSTIDQFVSFNLPSDYAKYHARTQASALNDVTDLYDNKDLNYGNFYSYDAEDSAKQIYKVGNQGVFSFKPSAQVKKAGATEHTTINNPSTVKTLQKFNGTAFEDVELDSYISIADNGYDYTFTANALNKTLKLIIKPSTIYGDTSAVTPLEFIFTVVKGYNVDSLAKLTLFDNFQNEWAPYKEEYGLAGVVAQESLVIHTDILVNPEIFPESLRWSRLEVDDYIKRNPDDFNTYWQSSLTPFKTADEAREAFYNSPKDTGLSIFVRHTEYEDFGIEGNYFSVDCSTAKPIILTGNKASPTLVGALSSDGSHTGLFGANPEFGNLGYPGLPSIGQKHDVTVRNLQIVGNGSLEKGFISSGGFIGFKVHTAGLKVENVISSKLFTSMMTGKYSGIKEYSDFVADRYTSIDTYSSSFYVWGTYYNTVTNSWFSKSGGPLFILDEPELGDKKYGTEGSFYPNVTATNTFLDNPVTGAEPWFTQHSPADILVRSAIIDAGDATSPSETGGWFGKLGAYYAAQGAVYATKTLSKKVDDTTSVCNFIAVDANCNNFVNNTTYDLGGSFRIINGTEDYSMDMDQVKKTSPSPTTPLVPTAACPFIVTSSGDPDYGGVHSDPIAYVDSSLGVHADSYGHVFTGNYMSMYLDPTLYLSQSTAGKFVSVLLKSYNR